MSNLFLYTSEDGQTRLELPNLAAVKESLTTGDTLNELAAMNNQKDRDNE